MKTFLNAIGQIIVAAGIWSAIIHFLVYLIFQSSYANEFSCAVLAALLN